MPADVTVVIACYTLQRWSSLLRAIDSVRAQTYANDLIVVVDHNDALFDRLRDTCPADVAIVRNAGPQGVSSARNTAALGAATELVAFLDDDAYAEPDWLERLVAAAARPGAVGAGGRIVPAWHSRSPRWFPHEFGWVVGESMPSRDDTTRRVRNVWSASMLVRRDVFTATGGFRVGFGKVGDASEPEDTELCLRMAAIAPDAHWLFVPDAVIHHEVPSQRETWSYFLRRCWLEGRGKARLAAVAPDRDHALSAERTHVRHTLPRAVVQALRDVARGDLAGIGRATAIVAGLVAAGLAFTLAGGVTRPSRAAVRPNRRQVRSGARRRTARPLPILMYHSIPAQRPRDPDPLCVPLDELRVHLATLRDDGWELLGLTEALTTVDRDPARRVVALTFDDGYADFLGALGVLEEVGARSTLYVSTGTVGTITAGGHGRMLTWGELADLPARGVEIGSHAHHHRPLDVLPDAVIREEVVASRRMLEQRLGGPVTSFCFPNGYTSRRVRRALIRAGYTTACIVGRRLATLDDERYALPRLQVTPGMSAADVRALVRAGEPGIVPLLKRLAQPAWRVVRLVSLRVLQRELT